MSASQSATVNRADASRMEADPPKLPAGWKYCERIGGWGEYGIVEDPDFVGERGPKPERIGSRIVNTSVHNNE